MTVQTFDTMHMLRLEVGQPPASGLRNLLKNPNGQRGAWGWRTPLTNSELSGSAAEVLTEGPLSFHTSLSSPTAYFTTELQPATPGKFYSGQIRIKSLAAGNFGTLEVRFLDAAGTDLGGVGSAAIASSTPVDTVITTTAAEAPAGTTHTLLQVNVSKAGGGVRDLSFDHAMLTEGATSGDVTGYAYVAPYTFTNILGSSYDITVQRSGLGLGQLNASIKDAALDPSTSTLIRPGNPVRLMAKDPTTATWEPIFWGDVLNGTTSYGAAGARIVLAAVDAGKTLGNRKQPAGVASVSDLRYMLEGAGVPWVINGDNSQPYGVPTVVAKQDNASMLDQVGFTRDTVLGYAWVSRWGALNAFDPGDLPATTRATLDENSYTADIGVDFDTSRCINEVTVKRLSLDIDGESVETPFGPYRDQPSIAAWGVFSEAFTVLALDDADVPAYAESILAANGTPVRRVNSLRLAVTQLAHFNRTTSRRVFLDLYDRVDVVNAGAGIDQELLITGVKHTIRPAKWLMDLEFASSGGVALPNY